MSTHDKPSVCILYGVCEGPRTGQRLRQALENRGFELINDPARADLIMTHSGGSLLLPEKVQAQQIIQVGPYWPTTPWVVATARKLIGDLRTHHAEGEVRFWIRKSFWNFVYLWKISTLIRMLRGIQQGRQWQHGKITTIVRPRFDSYCSPDYRPRFGDAPSFISLAGSHDDIWRDPRPYLALIKL